MAIDLLPFIFPNMRYDATRQSLRRGEQQAVRQATAGLQSRGAVNPAAAAMVQKQQISDFNSANAGRLSAARQADKAAQVQAGLGLAGTGLSLMGTIGGMSMGMGSGSNTGAATQALTKPAGAFQQSALGGVTQGQPASAEGVGVQRSMVTSAPQELPLPAQPATPAAQPGVLPEQQGSLPGFNPLQLRQPMVPAGDRGYVTPMIPIEDPPPEEQSPYISPFLQRRLRLGGNFGLR